MLYFPCQDKLHVLESRISQKKKMSLPISWIFQVFCFKDKKKSPLLLLAGQLLIASSTIIISPKSLSPILLHQALGLQCQHLGVVTMKLNTEIWIIKLMQ